MDDRPWSGCVEGAVAGSFGSTDGPWSYERRGGTALAADWAGPHPLYDLDKKLQAIRDPDNAILKKLKEAVFWTIKQCETWDQYS